MIQQSIYRSFHSQCVTVYIKYPVNCISLESLHSIDVIYANIQRTYIGCHLENIDFGHHTKHPDFFLKEEQMKNLKYVTINFYKNIIFGAFIKNIIFRG